MPMLQGAVAAICLGIGRILQWLTQRMITEQRNTFSQFFTDLHGFILICTSMLKQIAATVQELIRHCSTRRWLGAIAAWPGAVAVILSKLADSWGLNKHECQALLHAQIS
jgi:hypothetical protein